MVMCRSENIQVAQGAIDGRLITLSRAIVIEFKPAKSLYWAVKKMMVLSFLEKLHAVLFPRLFGGAQSMMQANGDLERYERFLGRWHLIMRNRHMLLWIL
jgi:hypothetical protein